MSSCSRVIPVHEQSQVGEARRAASQIARDAELPETEAGRVAIVATELANNLLRYATAGRIVVSVVRSSRGSAVDVLAIDEGPGIVDINRCLQDGYSTGGTPGSGLGAVRRLSTEFDIYSQPTRGTVVVSRVHAPAPEPGARSQVSWGGVSYPARGETVCGDAWRVTETPDGAAIMVADGLGHGPLAGEAAGVAATVFETESSAGPGRFLETAHARMSATRGAAVAAARFDAGAATLRYSGVGNIAGVLMTLTERRGLFSHNGIVGAQFRKAKELDYPWPASGLLIMHSDGLRSRWTLEDYPGLFGRHPTVIAAVLARDLPRGNDDVTVVVFRQQSSH